MSNSKSWMDKIKEAAHEEVPEAPTINLWGTGISLLDYRPIGDGTYEATRWITMFYIPLVPGPTWVVRPKRLGALPAGFGGTMEFERVGVRPTQVPRVLRTYAIGVSLAILALLPLGLSMTLDFNRLSEDGRILLALVSVAVPFGILFFVNRRTERLYEAAEAASKLTEPPVTTGGRRTSGCS